MPDHRTLFSVAKTQTEKWAALRRIYAEMQPSIEKSKGRTDPYFTDWSQEFTPIEFSAWSVLRCCRGVARMLPQYPAGRFFLDFGDPIKRIGLECDGKQWHDVVRDRRRDDELMRLGWRIYRVTGAECLRAVEHPVWDEAASHRELERWYMTSVEGVVESIAAVHYGVYPVTAWHHRSLHAHTLQPHDIGQPDADVDDEDDDL